MKDDNGLYYENAETNNIIWRGTCNEWRISNDSNHNGKCDKGEPLNFNEGEITQNCIIGLDGESGGKYGSEVLSGFTVECKKDQSK